jgi:hypothetical protein
LSGTFKKGALPKIRYAPFLKEMNHDQVKIDGPDGERRVVGQFNGGACSIFRQ